jgi:carbon-monoxide dehydrogenase large subunit
MGQPVRRSEDQRFITGRGRYTDDIVLPRQTYGYILRSPHAHARIRKIDTAAAAKAPGVVGVITGADLDRDGVGPIPCLTPIVNRDGSEAKLPARKALTTDKVRHVGDSVAMVVAETLAQAKDAAELIAVDYEPLPAVADTEGALRAGTPRVWDDLPSNLCFDWEVGKRKAVEAGFAKAKHRVSLKVVNNRLVVNSMETRAALGDYDAGEERYHLYTSSQGSHTLRGVLAGPIFKVPEHRIHVVTPDVGGGFGMKLFVYPEHVLVLHAAKRFGRPVRWVGERADAFVTDTHGRDNVTEAELALDENGKFLALRVDIVANMGAYLSLFSTFIPTGAGSAMHAGVYQTPAVVVHVKGVYTHTTPIDAYRGAGRPEAAYILERLVDHAARRLKLDPAELRRRNFIKPEQMPFPTALDRTYDSGNFQRNMEDALKAADRAGYAKRREESRAKGKLRGLGFATYIEECGGGEDEMAELRFDASGELTLLIGTQSSGQGHQTAYAQIVADKLGIPFESIRMMQGDSDVVSFGRGTGGSRSVPVGGGAIGRAAEKIIAKGRKIAAHKLEASEADIEFADGVFSIAGTDRRMSMTEVARAAFDSMSLPKEIDPGLDEAAHFAPPASTYPNGCHVCEVEIDPDTGITGIVRYVVVDDFGTVVNPLLLAGQVHGGIAQGVGQALLEGCVYDAQSGQLVTGSLMDYCMPRADNLPTIEFAYNVVPCATNPLGIKGAGEAGAIGAPPAVINAIVDALGELGIEHVDMPATPRRLWEAIRKARTPRAAE